MADEEMEAEAPAQDPSAGLATALIILTTLMLITATFSTLKLLGDRYHEGMLASK
jgi:hypothetical protein